MQGWACVVYQFKRHLREPFTRRRILSIAHRIEWATSPAVTLTVRLTRSLYPQISIKQRHTGISSWPETETSVRWVAPFLRITDRVGGRSPGSHTIAARVNYEMGHRDD